MLLREYFFLRFKHTSHRLNIPPPCILENESFSRRFFGHNPFKMLLKSKTINSQFCHRREIVIHVELYRFRRNLIQIKALKF